MGVTGVTRRSFLGKSGGLTLAMAAGGFLHRGPFWARAAPATAKVVESGASTSKLTAWAGRGCSAVASALNGVGAFPNTPYQVEFDKETALVLTGIDVAALSVDEDLEVRASSGFEWCLAALPGAAKGMRAQLSITVGDETLSVA